MEKKKEMTELNIEEIFTELEKDDPRKAAEIAYAIAMIARENGENDKVIKFAGKSVAIFEKIKVETLTECATFYTVINGISLPEFIHAEAVKKRILPLKI